jgi:hypothetical protein
MLFDFFCLQKFVETVYSVLSAICQGNLTPNRAKLSSTINKKEIFITNKIPPPHEKGWRERKDSRQIVMCATAALSTNESN